MNKLFTENLPKYKGKAVDWCQCTNRDVSFICNNINGTVHIIKYYKNKKYIRFIYNGHTFFKNIDSFRNGDLTDCIQLKEDGYYYNIGDIVETLSGKLKIIDISRFNHSKAYIYKCLIDGFEWVITQYHLLDKHGCTICGGKTVEIGINDTMTTNPKLASMLVDQNEGYLYSQNSHHKTDWKCLECGFIIKNKSFKDINQDGLRCPRCNDGFPYGEKFITALLNQLNINFCNRYYFDWLNKEYDIYIPDKKCIIEVHGMQHYEDIHFGGVKRRTFCEESENDKLKYETAIKNGIQKYIIIDARYSNLNWIKKSVLKSELNFIYDLSKINWEICQSYAVKSLVKTACNLWNNNPDYTIKDIREKLKKSDSTIRDWLKKGASLGWCDYYPGSRKFNGKCNYCNGKNKVKNQSYLENGIEYIKMQNNFWFNRKILFCPYCKKEQI